MRPSKHTESPKSAKKSMLSLIRKLLKIESVRMHFGDNTKMEFASKCAHIARPKCSMRSRKGTSLTLTALTGTLHTLSLLTLSSEPSAETIKKRLRTP